MLRPRPELRRTTVRIKRTGEEGNNGTENKLRTEEESILSEFPMPSSLKISPKKLSPKKTSPKKSINSTISPASKSATELFVRSIFTRSLSHPPTYATRSSAPLLKVESKWIDSESEASLNGETLEDTACNSEREFGTILRIDPSARSQPSGLESPHPYSSPSLDPTREFLPSSYVVTVSNPSTDTLLSSRAEAMFPKRHPSAQTPTSMVNQVTEPSPGKRNMKREQELEENIDEKGNTTNMVISELGPKSPSECSHPYANVYSDVPHIEQPLSSSPLAKRKRSSEDAAIPFSHEDSQPEKRVKTKEDYTKHPVYWAADGNILIQIAHTRFSLYRGYLAKHSGWFRLVFEDCGGVEDPGEEATLNQQGDRIVVLDDTGVTVKDFECLLGALDESIDYCYSPPPFPTVAAILRVSHILCFPRYAAWATQYLTNMWPTSLASVSASRIPFAKTSVALARQCGLSLILKRALYELVRQDGFGQDDDTTLSPADYQALLRAREHLASAWIKAAACPAPQFAKCLSDTPHCAAHDPNSVNSAHIELVHASGIFEVHLYDPICGLQALVEEPKLCERFCEACVGLRKDTWMNEREKVWAGLDTWLGLGTVDA